MGELAFLTSFVIASSRVFTISPFAEATQIDKAAVDAKIISSFVSVESHKQSVEVP